MTLPAIAAWILGFLALLVGIGWGAAWLILGHNPFHRGPCPRR